MAFLQNPVLSLLARVMFILNKNASKRSGPCEQRLPQGF